MEPRLAEKLAKVHWYLSARNLKVHYTLWSQWITNGEVRQGTKFVLGGRLRYFGHLSHANPLSSGTCHGHTRISGHGDAPDLHRAGSIYEQLSKISEGSGVCKKACTESRFVEVNRRNGINVFD